MIRSPPSGMLNVFLALFPTSSAADKISLALAELVDRHALRIRPRPRDIFHLSLFGVAGGHEIPAAIIEASCRAGDAASHFAAPFVLELHYALSFRGQPNSHPLVLIAEKTHNSALMNFHQLLRTELRRNMLPARGGFTPHVTLGYGDDIQRESIHPISWKVEDFALVLSHIGQGHYEILRSWKLRSPSEPPVKPLAGDQASCPLDQGEFGWL